jgi:hypothetical protein
MTWTTSTIRGRKPRSLSDMQMNEGFYRVAASLAGHHLVGYLPKPYRIAGPAPHALPLRAKAIYVVVDAAGVIRYVGSVCRPRRTAIRERTAEHVTEWFKRQNWSTVYVLPLDPATPSVTVKQIEGRIGRRLQPLDNRRLPAAAA